MNELLSVYLPLSSQARSALEQLPTAFFDPDTLSARQQELVAAAFVALDVVTKGKMAPRPFQLEVMLSIMAGRDCVVRAGTGSGKTLAMMLPQLLNPDEVVITVSPLKMLHTQHVKNLNAYGLRAIAINEDTEFTPELYKNLRSGALNHIVTSPEQLTVVRGVITRLGRMMHERTFTDLIRRVNIDEAHFIKTAGQASGTDDAFRPAFGKLGELRVHLGRNVNIAAFSATMDCGVTRVVMSSLHMKESNTDIIRLSSNRANLSYGVIGMLGSVKNFLNIRFLVPNDLNDSSTLTDLHKGVIFIENKIITDQIANYLNALLPQHLRKLMPFWHLHSSMSTGYLTDTYAEFIDPKGSCRCLVATGTASHGLDQPDIRYCICYGTPESTLDAEQKMGRIGRDGTSPCFAITIAESWSLELKSNGSQEADKPAPALNPKTRSKQLRTEEPMKGYLQTEDCRRLYLSQINHDTSTEGLS